MKEFEFIYCIRDGFQFHSDNEIFSSEVVRGKNKILAEESFLDILKDRGVDIMMVQLISVEELPSMEDNISPSLEEEIWEEDEMFGEQEDYE